MAMDLVALQQQIKSLGLHWTAGETTNSNHTDAQAKRRTGYVPGPNDISLERAEQVARDAEVIARQKLALMAAGGVHALVGGGPPATYDWRNVGGKNYVTPIEDQGDCGSCVAFGTIAALETLVRITHRDPNLAVDLSEAQLFFCYGPSNGAGKCPDGGWNADAAYNCLKQGIVPASCFPYTSADQPCKLCSGWQNQLTKITNWHKLTTQADMKAYLSTSGALTACFTVYSDFYYHYTGGVYTYNPATAGAVIGGHCVCIVGYDDNLRCWIAKNSWGPGWGESGYFRMSYGSCGLDSQMWGINSLVPMTGLLPVWMVPSPISGPAGNWSRGPDVFTAADVDGDGHVEVVISNNTDGWTGVLKWNGTALAPIWMIPSPIGGWKRGPDVFTAADVDGDRHAEIVISNNTDGWTGVLKWNGKALAPIWMVASPISGPAGKWSRGPDVFTAGDVDGDGHTELVISNNADGWTGVLKWDGKQLAPVWMVASPISGPAGKWSRGPDVFTAADVDGDGHAEIVISNNVDGWTGVLKWTGKVLEPIWMIPSPISGPAGTWRRGPDVFTAADVDGDGHVEIVISNNADGWTGVLKWNGKALAPIWMVPSPISGPAGNWSRGPDIFTAADVDGDGHKEILISNNSDGWTGVLKWNGKALAPVWMVPSPIYGEVGNWSRGPDIFTAADVDGDKHTELVISNNTDHWTGVLKWIV
jgi:C1A family cysteine protease